MAEPSASVTVILTVDRPAACLGDVGIVVAVVIGLVDDIRAVAQQFIAIVHHSLLPIVVAHGIAVHAGHTGNRDAHRVGRVRYFELACGLPDTAEGPGLEADGSTFVGIAPRHVDIDALGLQVQCGCEAQKGYL